MIGGSISASCSTMATATSATSTSIAVAVRPQRVNPTMATTLRRQQLHGQMQRSKCKQFDAGTTTTTTSGVMR